MRSIFFSFIVLFISCENAGTDSKFKLMQASSGVSFTNHLKYTEDFNPYTYRNFYNGGGVALGDINNDSLLDIYFTGNMVDNKLYLNKGNWIFEDITLQAGVACKDVWSSGATFVDINGDGLLDLYVCKSGKPEGKNRHNELFINNGDSTFTDRSREYGLDILGLSTQAAFFDYDKDGDLDCYILTNSVRSVGGYDLVPDQREIPDPEGGGNKFMKNENGVFIDHTQQSGIYSSNIGFGLGITLSDFNGDSWTDIFISNDFFERDYLYINDQKGGFVEDLENNFNSISMGSMGADAADLNNDNFSDIMVTEMLPATIQRMRTKTIFESWDKYSLAVGKGYFHQFPRNVLQRNTGGNGFLEIGRYSGVSATEWSWGALIFDMDNDGLKDIFVSNGIYKDLLDRDYLTYMANEERVRSILKEKDSVVKELIDIMPSEPVSNFAFKNMANFRFENKAADWGLDTKSFSNGSAYGDIDNDGDLDLVVNNVNMPSFLYMNKTDTSDHRSLRVRLQGNGLNTYAIGAKVWIRYGDKQSMIENYPSRGFEGSVDPVLHFGVGSALKVDTLRIEWPNGVIDQKTNLPTNGVYTFEQPEGSVDIRVKTQQKYPSELVSSDLTISYNHEENAFVDFNRERLLPQMFNNEGPVMAQADVNKDGYVDLYIGGSKGYSGNLFLGSERGFDRKHIEAFEGDKISEDSDALFFDADGDGHLDLYVASGGRSFSSTSAALEDRLYLNDGKGNFSKTVERLPVSTPSATGAVAAADYDRDGDTDLFVAERFHPFYYGLVCKGAILRNDGDGLFSKVALKKGDSLGMTTEAEWTDLNGDSWPDLVVVGEWMPVKVFINEQGVLAERTTDYGLERTSGLWNVLNVTDLDQDGDQDLIVGNHGLNSFLKPGTRMYVNDFDQNGSVEQIICHQINDQYYPVADRNELISQLPSLKKKLLYFKDYASSTIHTLFDEETLKKSIKYDVDIMETSLFINNGKFFERRSLPAEIQYFPVYAIEVLDINSDRTLDICFGGNQYLVKPQFGRYDASEGAILYQQEGNQLEWKNLVNTRIKGQIRAIEAIEVRNRIYLIFALNDGPVKIYEPSKN